MLRAGAHQGVEVGRPSRRLVGAGKQIVLATEGNVAELLFTDIVVQAHAAVVDEAGQRPPMIHPVRRGLRQVCARRLVGGRDQEPPVRLIQDGLRPCAPQVDPPLGGRARASAICSRRYKPAMVPLNDRCMNIWFELPIKAVLSVTQEILQRFRI